MSKLIRLLLAFAIGITCNSIRAENASPAHGSATDMPRGCEYVNIGKAWKDLPEHADLVDSEKILYDYELLSCQGVPNHDKHFRLRLVSSDEIVDELILPWSDVNPTRFYLEPDCENNMRGASAHPGHFVGAIGAGLNGVGEPIQVKDDTAYSSYEVGGIIWAWHFELKSKKLRLVSKKGLRCATDQAF